MQLHNGTEHDGNVLLRSSDVQYLVNVTSMCQSIAPEKGDGKNDNLFEQCMIIDLIVILLVSDDR